MAAGAAVGGVSAVAIAAAAIALWRRKQRQTGGENGEKAQAQRVADQACEDVLKTGAYAQGV